MLYRADIRAIELSVGELCAMAHKGGSLDARHPRRRIAGAENERSPDDGVLLTHTEEYHGIRFMVRGLADAVTEEEGRLVVEETKSIKGHRLSRAAREDAYSRLRCYAHFLCAERDLPAALLRVRAINAASGEAELFTEQVSRQELAAFFEGLLARIEPFAKYERLRREELIPSVRHIDFPYASPREGQIDLAEATFRAIRQGKRLFANAPTGIGKTMSVLYPAVKALGYGFCERVFYLTAKASTRREAYAAAGKLFEAGARLRTVILYAKEQMCLCESGCREGNASHCTPEHCPYAAGYYDRVDGALLALLSKQNGFPMRALLEAGKQYRVCPYELSLDLSEWCEIIICDYNYVFDPAAYLRRYFDRSEGERGEYAFLIDEAHNLPDRARDMHSAILAGEVFERVLAQVDPMADAELEADLGGWVLRFRGLAALCTEHRTKNEDGTESGYYLNRAPLPQLGEESLLLSKKLDTLLRTTPQHPLAAELADLSARLRRFASLSEYYDERFLTYILLENGRLELRLICLDPAGVVHSALGRAKAAVLFSATLTPLDYFVDVLGGGRGAQRLLLDSPYDPERLSVTVASGVSTRMEDRARSYKKISSLIAAAVSAKAGNYMVYFPSYEYMEHVLDVFRARYPGVCCIVQKRHMTVAEREAFLGEFKDDEGRLRVGFCVLGGSFSEGVDLPGSRLIGAVIVGVGIPGLSDERNILRDYYENKCERGYDYAYTFPGMNRVLQAAGRVIRREEDRGIVVLIDDRYAEEPYLHLYPTHWQNPVAAGNAAALARRVQQFWEKHC